MKRLILISILAAAIVPVQAQTYGTLSGVFAANPASRVLQEGFANNQLVKGKPFSATEERHSLQVLGDGTRIETTQTNRLFRDSEGRTREEEMNGLVSIYDPSTRARIELDPATKTARKGTGLLSYYRTVNGGASQSSTALALRNSLSPAPGGRGNAANLQGVMAETTENLPAQPLNGVTAQGIRTTMTIPKGQIGNNRDIKVMSERWFSNDLQMLIKSANNDPRFGDTTYQLTKIVQSEPDASLFQIPPGYTEVTTAAPAVNTGEPALRRTPAPGAGAARGPQPRPVPAPRVP
jgi:hypothetical protein